MAHSGEHHEAGSVSQLFLAGLVMACAIALHKPARRAWSRVLLCRHGGDRDRVFRTAVFVMAVVIGLHNIPEGMAIAVPLIAGGVVKVEGDPDHGALGRTRPSSERRWGIIWAWPAPCPCPCP